jgi:hypothetical protein
MKKLITLTLMGVVLLSGTAFSQDAPVRDRPTDRHSDFRIPRAVRDNVDIQECLEAYRTASAGFKTSLMGLRTELEAAAEAEKDAVKQRIRSLLHDHRIAQREFRQKVRRIIRALREARVATDAAG